LAVRFTFWRRGGLRDIVDRLLERLITSTSPEDAAQVLGVAGPAPREKDRSEPEAEGGKKLEKKAQKPKTLGRAPRLFNKSGSSR